MNWIDWTLIICVYPLVITIPTFTIVNYFMERKNGRRRAIVDSVKAGLFSLIPILPSLAICGLILYIIKKAIWKLGSFLERKTKEWIIDDPTDPKNIENPDFKPKVKKKIKKPKKAKPVKNRFEIMDI